QAGQFDEAVVHHKDAVRCAPENARYHFSLGEALFGRGTLEDAVSCYRRAVGLDASFCDAAHRLARVLMTTGDPVGAEQAVRQALDANPGNVHYLITLGQALVKQQRWPDAAAAWQDVLHHDPDSAYARDQLNRIEARRVAERGGSS
ncbi:MAG TPA: tetratricopeptide repeat protein, partial [Aestuariivirgaceae bacterium]|nr:tetratricopeptide repeat protein [Aestuariivirgaceae bacterium]